MPHQCTTCERTFDDGSKQMLAGCPDCGGKKFQFLPPGALEDDQSAGAEPAGTPAATAAGSGAGAGDTDADIIEAPAEPLTESGEDRAQASARRSVVSPDELPATDEREGTTESQPTDEEPEPPDLAQLREELNEQFESIKILRPGEYELNLMELYDREEYIIALEEDGRYVIDVPDSWPDR